MPDRAAGWDTRVWRVLGDPLVAGAAHGPLEGRGVAVKDLYAVAGQRVGGGVPAWLAESPVEAATAPAVQQLVDAGADVLGIAQTDEFAYSIAGLNPHYGTPPNPAVPGGMPGGSSSGPASAVALGEADIGLGTDTGGSVRVPASYQGLWGIRTTHDAVPRQGLLPLAPSFDTVGWLTRDLDLLTRVVRVALPAGPPTAPVLAVADALLDLLEPAVRQAFLDAARALGPLERVDVGDVEATFEAFRTVQAFEAWQVHGPWLEAHPDAVRGAVAERFAVAARVTAADAAAARDTVHARRAALRALLGEVTLVLPSASGPAPSARASAAEIERTRFGTLRLTALPGTAGAPALSMPLAEVGGRPLGVCLVGGPGTDAGLLALAAERLASRKGLQDRP